MTRSMSLYEFFYIMQIITKKLQVITSANFFRLMCGSIRLEKALLTLHGFYEIEKSSNFLIAKTGQVDFTSVLYSEQIIGCYLEFFRNLYKDII